MSEENKNTPENISMSMEKVSEEDHLIMELAKSNRKLALANAEKALAQNEAAEANHRYIILQIYMKYGLNPSTDVLNEDGTIQRGVNKPQ